MGWVGGGGKGLRGAESCQVVKKLNGMGGESVGFLSSRHQICCSFIISLLWRELGQNGTFLIKIFVRLRRPLSQLIRYL